MTWSELERARATIATNFDQHAVLEAVRDEDGKIVDFTYVDANDAAVVFTGRPRAQLIGARLLDVVPGQKDSGLFDLCVHTVETGEPLVLDGVPYHDEIHDDANHFGDIRGAKVGDAISFTFRDVTDRIETQRRLEESEQRFRLAMERSAIGMCLVAPDGHFLTVNDALSAMLGIERDELLHCTWQELTHPDDLEGDLTLVEEVQRGARDHYRLLKRFLRRDGSVIWGDLSVGCVRELTGEVRYFISQVVDLTELMEVRAAIAESEAHFRLLAESASDVVYEASPDGEIRWLSPSVERVLGYTPEELVGRNAFDLVDPRYSEDPETLKGRVFAGRTTGRHVQLFFTKDGAGRWMSVEARPVFGPEGRVDSAVVTLRDSQQEVTVRRANETLTAVNELLLRVHDERALLTEMCEIAVDRGRYRFSWYGRPTSGPDHRVEPVATSFALREYLDEVEIAWDDSPRGQGPTGRAIRTGTVQVVHDFLDDTTYAPWRDAATRRGFRSSVSIPVLVDGVIDGAWMVYASEADAFTPAAIALLEELAGQLGYGLGRLRDGVKLVESVRARALLGTAIDQAAEAVMVTAPDGEILYVNPATTASSGYTADELLGATPRIFNSGVHDPAFFDDMWGELTAGRPWHGVIVNRRKDGDLYEEDVAISPVNDDDGALIAYVGVKRDLTEERRLEAELSDEQRDRAAIISLVDTVRPGETVEATASEFCAAVCRLGPIDVATVLLVDPGGQLVVAGLTNTLRPRHDPVAADTPVVVGDWVEAMGSGGVRFDDLAGADDVDDAPGSPFGAARAAARAAGLLAVSSAAIHWEDRTLGILALGAATPEHRERLRHRAGLVEEIASIAGLLLGRQLAQRLDEQTTRDDLQTILAGRRFHPEFQPIVDLASGAVQGYEALARFDDGTRPDVEFERARAVGLGSELEAACAKAALVTASSLPPDVWVSVNFSPAALLDGTAAEVLRDATRPVVIEVTEHAVIERYDHVRRAVAECSGARLSVDDAGAGFASLRHILELAPTFVKLDIGLVRDIDHDLARQALAAGLVHFATQTGIVLVAEGVETEAEAQTLRVLGVRLGQGYLFGRPAPLP